MMQAAGPEAALRDLEAAPLAENHVFDRNAHAFERDFAMPVRCVVVPEHGERPYDAHAGRLDRH